MGVRGSGRPLRQPVGCGRALACSCCHCRCCAAAASPPAERCGAQQQSKGRHRPFHVDAGATLITPPARRTGTAQWTTLARWGCWACGSACRQSFLRSRRAAAPRHGPALLRHPSPCRPTPLQDYLTHDYTSNSVSSKEAIDKLRNETLAFFGASPEEYLVGASTHRLSRGGSGRGRGRPVPASERWFVAAASRSSSCRAAGSSLLNS